jgi:4-amino-4-deoxy-L-arabinose transferase-like glycosyltransferase
MNLNLLSDLFKKIHNSRILSFFIFSGSILFSLFFLLFFRNIGPSEHQTPGTDFLVRYEPIANNILAGKGITLEGKVHPEFAPGFSVILAGLFGLSSISGINKFDLIVALNIVLGAASAVLLFLIAKESFGEKIALISSFLWMTYPFNLWFIKNPNTEPLFIPLIFLTVLFYILALKKKSLIFLFLAGFLAGASTLVRLNGFFLPFLLAAISPFLFSEAKKSLKYFLFPLLIIAGAFFALLPWGIYSFSNTGSFLPVSDMTSSGISGGYIFLLGENKIGDQSVLSEKTTEILKDLEIQSRKGNATKLLLSDILNYPGVFLKLTLLRVVRAWYGTGMMWWEGKIILVQLPYLISAVFGIFYSLKIYKDKKKCIFFLFLIVLYFWALSAATFSILRYTIPAMGILIIFSSITAVFLLGKIISKIRKSQ